MRTSSLALVTVLALSSAAHADDTFTDRERFGVDLMLLYAPTEHIVDGGAAFSFTLESSRFPEWMFMTLRAGLLTGKSEKTMMPLLVGYGIGRGDGPFIAADFGWIFSHPNDDARDDSTDLTFEGSVGYRVGAWKVSAGALYSDAFEDQTFMFTLGRDLVQLDSTTTRTSL